MIDVIFNIYGKPYQTIATIQTMLQHSGQWIDKMYINFEPGEPHNDVGYKDIIRAAYPDAIYSEANNHLWATEGDDRFDIRYQYAIEHSDKKHILITHNDIHYTADLIGAMLDVVADNAGVGLVGQCWNCPAYRGGVCGHEIFPAFQDREVMIDMFEKYGAARMLSVPKENYFPFLECRLNEFACLINREIALKSDKWFGLIGSGDIGQAWFCDLFNKGYRFKNIDIYKYCVHGYFASDAGHPTLLNEYKYRESERKAKEFLIENNWL